MVMWHIPHISTCGVNICQCCQHSFSRNCSYINIREFPLVPTPNPCSEDPVTSYQVMTVVPLRIRAWPCPFLSAYSLEIVMAFSYLCYTDETLLYLSFLKDVSVLGIFALQTTSAWMEHQQYQRFKDQATCYPCKSLDITQYHCQNLLYSHSSRAYSTFSSYPCGLQMTPPVHATKSETSVNFSTYSTLQIASQQSFVSNISSMSVIVKSNHCVMLLLPSASIFLQLFSGLSVEISTAPVVLKHLMQMLILYATPLVVFSFSFLFFFRKLLPKCANLNAKVESKNATS